jgi:hypothetical protein
LAVQPGVHVYTGAHLLVGQLNPERRRLSDHLNDPNTNFVELDQAVWYDLLSDDGPPVAAGHVTIRKEIIQVVVPQEPADPHAPSRVQTQQITLTLAYPLLTVSGAVFRRPGDPNTLMQLFAQQGRQFVPVGSAVVRFLPNNRFDTTLPLVLVNARQINYWWASQP